MAENSFANIDETHVINTILRNVEDLPQNADPSASFASLGIDSLTTIEITLALQNEYDIKIEDHEVIEAKNLEGCAQLVLSKFV